MSRPSVDSFSLLPPVSRPPPVEIAFLLDHGVAPALLLFVTLCVAVLAGHLHDITMAIHTADTSRIPLISQGNTPHRNVACTPQYRASECPNPL